MSVDMMLYERLQHYLQGKMTTDEKSSFELELENNKELYEEYQSELEIADHLAMMKEEKEITEFDVARKGTNPLDDPAYMIRMIQTGLVSHVKPYDSASGKEGKKNNTGSVVSMRWPIIRYAAGVAAALILFATGYYLWGPGKTAKYSLASIEPVAIDKQLDFMYPTKGGRDPIFELLAEQKFDKFLSEAEAVFTDNKGDKELNYALLHTLLYKNDMKKAADVYEQLPSDLKVKDEFTYLKALLDLKGGKAADKNNAIASFHELERKLPTGHPLKLNSSVILKKLIH